MTVAMVSRLHFRPWSSAIEGDRQREICNEHDLSELEDLAGY